MYPMLAGVPSMEPSAASTSDAVAASAGRRTTSTPSIASSVAPATTASNIACIAGDGVWWTTSSVGTSGLGVGSGAYRYRDQHRPSRSRSAAAGLAAVTRGAAPATRGRAPAADLLDRQPAATDPVVDHRVHLVPTDADPVGDVVQAGAAAGGANLGQYLAQHAHVSNLPT